MKIKKVLISFFGIILASIIFSFLLINAKYQIPQYEPSSEVLNEIISSQNSGNTVVINEDKLNSLIAKLLEKPIEKQGIIIKNAYVKLNKDIDLIAALDYRNKEWYFYTSLSLNYNDEGIVITPKSFKLGKMPVPIKVLMNLIKENEFVKDNRFIITREKMPLSIEHFKVENRAIILKLTKMDLFESTRNNFENKTNNIAQDVKKETNNSSGNNTSSQTTNKKKETKKLPDDVEKSMKKIIGGLNKVYPQLETSQEKAIISTIQSTLNNVVKDPDYPYKKYAASVKAKYKKLPEESKTRIKSALFNSLDFGDVMKLVSVFGM